MFTKEIMDTFSELDFAVYDCIINNRERVSSMTIKELGNLAHVSTATVLRFCKKSGVNGYSEFKIKYKEYLEGKRDALKDDGTTELQSFLKTINSEDFQSSISNAYGFLQNSQCTIFIGVGSSGILGKYGARFFSNVGHFSLFIDDPWLPVLQKLAENTVTIALSNPDQQDRPFL